jgi:hypothetical protein
MKFNKKYGRGRPKKGEKRKGKLTKTELETPDRVIVTRDIMENRLYYVVRDNNA